MFHRLQNLIHDSVDNFKKISIENILEMYLYFITLKYKYPNIYSIITQGEFSLERLGEPTSGFKKMETLSEKYIVSDNIRRLLRAVQLEINLDKNSALEYCLSVNISTEISFGNHIEKTIEMFN